MASKFAKEDALKCLDVAKRAFEENDFAKAQKFALKAKKLCDCAEVTLFLKKLSSHSQPASTSRPFLRQSPIQKGTEEQRALVAKIRRSKDFYETLDIPREASDDEIKRAYKKVHRSNAAISDVRDCLVQLALKLHPDKNKAAGAEEAFKSVSRAFSCLSDPEKRRNYDRYGTEDEQHMAHSSAHHREFYSDDLDPDEIFRMFFGGGFPMHESDVLRRRFFGQRFRRGHQRNGTPGANGSTPRGQMFNLFSLLPLVLFIFLSLFNGGNEEVYSLVKEYPYEQEILTQNRGIAFFVKSRHRFSQTYPLGTRNRAILENNVEILTRRILEENCHEERRKQRRIRSVRGDAAADRFELKACFELKDKFSPEAAKKTQTIKSH